MKTMVALLLTVVLLLSSVYAESATDALQELYAQGELLMVQGDYAGAAAKFEALGTYSDASQMAMYCKAIAAAETLGLHSMAVDAFNDLGDFKDSKQMAKYYEGRAHEAAGTMDVATASDSALVQALWQLEEAEKVYGGLAFFKDSLTRYGACGERIKEIKGEQSRRAAEKREETYRSALTLEQNGDYAEAIKLYKSIKEYKDSAERIVICETAILDGMYDVAVALLEAGKYSEAYDAFIALDGYRDSASKAESIYWKAIKVGGYITFGSYEQDNNTTNGKEDIEWLVLAKENNRLLVISRYALAGKPYNNAWMNVTWETCTLRTWLNKDFINVAFSSAEQARIPSVMVSADKNPEYSTDPGNDTQDKVFLLSVAEADKYFNTGSERQCVPTAYAKVQGAVQNSDGYCWWWLRSPGREQNLVADIRTGGVYSSGIAPRSLGVRPAMWINLEP